MDYHFALSLARITGTGDELALLGAAAVSRVTSLGHVCLELERLGATPVESSEGEVLPDLRWPESAPWLDSLTKSPLVSDGTREAPLVLDTAGRLYLYRYFDYQRRLAVQIRTRARDPVGDIADHVLREGLARLFPAPVGSGEQLRDHDRQKLAAAVAILRQLTIIIGGPGTGKTSTVVKILALIIEQAKAVGRVLPRVLLMAPTGKAAARLSQAIQIATASQVGLSCSEEIRAAIPQEAATIHRVLGYNVNKPTRFFHTIDNPLSVDVLVMDEASMVDLALMTKLFEAVPPHARIIILGDRDQLSSIEAGAVLGDIGRGADRPEVSRAFQNRLGLILERCPYFSRKKRRYRALGIASSHSPTTTGLMNTAVSVDSLRPFNGQTLSRACAAWKQARPTSRWLSRQPLSIRLTRSCRSSLSASKNTSAPKTPASGFALWGGFASYVLTATGAPVLNGLTH